MVIAAIVAGSIALIVAAFTLYGNRIAADERADLRQRLKDAESELELCNKERLDLRRRVELVTAALIGLLPKAERFELLRSLEPGLPAPAERGAA